MLTFVLGEGGIAKRKENITMTWDQILEEALKMNVGDRKEFVLDHEPEPDVEINIFSNQLETRAGAGKKFVLNRSGTTLAINCSENKN